VFSVTFFLFSSDIFVTLRYAISTEIADCREQFRPRIYAITSKNKLLTVYFGALALARMAVPFVSAIVEPPTITNLPPIPIDFFNLCAVKINLQLMVIPNSIGSVFGKQFPSLQLPTQKPRITERGTPRNIRVPRHRLAHIPHQELARTLRLDSRDHDRGHDIFPRYGRFAGVRAGILDFHEGTVSLSLSTHAFVVTDGGYLRAPFNNFRFCECLVKA